MLLKNESKLEEVLKTIDQGETQLPDFQRGWVWDNDRICRLIASITNKFPIGAAMLLPYRSSKIRFKYRPVEGVRLANADTKAEYLILDGQQRFTSLYRSLYSREPVETTDAYKKATQRYYYIDIKACFNNSVDRVDAIISVPKDRIITQNIGRDIKLDLSSAEKEYEAHCFPLNIVFDRQACNEWSRGYLSHFEMSNEIWNLWNKFNDTIIKAILDYKITLMILDEDVSKEGVCQVFENVNQGGVSLTVFELVTASFAAEDFELRKDWQEIYDDLSQDKLILSGDYESFGSVSFLTAMTLLTSYNRVKAKESELVTAKKRDVLKLEFKDYLRYRDSLIAGVKDALKFLKRQCIFTSIDMPYTSQLIPLSVLFAIDSKLWTDPANSDKLQKWFWCGIFGELYGGANETRFANDVTGMMEWVADNEKLPETVIRSSFNRSRLFSLRTRNSAAYKGIIAILLKNGAADFRSGERMNETNFIGDQIDIHHIFPSKYCTEQNFEINIWNSVVNKTPIEGSTNRSIGGRAPSEYLKSLERQLNDRIKLDENLRSHLIDPELLRQDDFSTFIERRADALCDLIEERTGKRVARD